MTSKALRAYVRNHSFAAVVSRLEKGKLETKSFFSQDRSIVFVKIRATLERLCRQASQENFKVPLCDRRVKQKLAQGQWDDEERRYRWAPKAYSIKLLQKAEDPAWAAANYRRGGAMSQDQLEYMIIRDDSREASRFPQQKRRVVARVYPIKDDQAQSSFKYYSHHYGPYNDRSALDPDGGLFKVNERSGSPFRGVDRLKLLKNIIEGEGKDGGCDLDVGKMVENQCVLACFPLHDEDPCIEMQQAVNVAWKMPWKLEEAIVNVKDYHGEKIGVYFTFLATYSSWLFVASFVGVLAFVAIAIEGSRTAGRLGSYRTHGSSLFVTVFAVFVLLWSTAFLEDWKRKQIFTAMKWGTRGFESQEKDRPEFLANVDNLVINSPVDGRKVVYFPDTKRTQRIACSYVAVCSFAVMVVAAIVAVFIFKAFTDPNQVCGVYHVLLYCAWASFTVVLPALLSDTSRFAVCSASRISCATTTLMIGRGFNEARSMGSPPCAVQVRVGAASASARTLAFSAFLKSPSGPSSQPSWCHCSSSCSMPSGPASPPA